MSTSDMTQVRCLGVPGDVLVNVPTAGPVNEVAAPAVVIVSTPPGIRVAAPAIVGELPSSDISACMSFEQPFCDFRKIIGWRDTGGGLKEAIYDRDITFEAFITSGDVPVATTVGEVPTAGASVDKLDKLTYVGGSLGPLVTTMYIGPDGSIVCGTFNGRPSQGVSLDSLVQAMASFTPESGAGLTTFQSDSSRSPDFLIAVNGA